MPLKVYDTEDAIPQDEREDYAEDGGKWRHKVEIEAAAEKRKRAQLLTEKRKRSGCARKQETRLAEAERAPRRRGGRQRDGSRRSADAEAAARKPIEDENATLKAENRKLKLTDRVQGALPRQRAGCRTGSEQAMKASTERTDLGDKDGIVLKDEDGNVTTDDDRGLSSRRHKKEKPWFYAGSGASGSGASGSNGTGGGTDTPPAPAAGAGIAARCRARSRTGP
jgi:hypothetical protein